MSTLIPENALKLAQEKYEEGNWQEAIEDLHSSLRYKRNRGNNAALEKLMVIPIHLIILVVHD